MNIIEKAIPHIFRNKYLQGQGGTVILGGSGGGSYSSSTGSGGASQLDDLTDVTVDYLKNEDILQFDEGSGQWKNKALTVDWSRVDNTPTTLEGYGITDAVDSEDFSAYKEKVSLKFSNIDLEIDSIKDINIDQNAEINSIKSINQKQDEKIYNIEVANITQDKVIQSIKEKNKLQDQEIEDIKEVNAEQSLDIKNIKLENAKQDREIAAIKEVNKKQDKEIADIKEVNAKQDQEIEEIKEVNRIQDQEIAEIKEVNERQDQEIEEIKEVNKEQDLKIQQNKEEIERIKEKIASQKLLCNDFENYDYVKILTLTAPSTVRLHINFSKIGSVIYDINCRDYTPDSSRDPRSINVIQVSNTFNDYYDLGGNFWDGLGYDKSILTINGDLYSVYNFYISNTFSVIHEDVEIMVVGTNFELKQQGYKGTFHSDYGGSGSNNLTEFYDKGVSANYIWINGRGKEVGAIYHYDESLGVTVPYLCGYKDNYGDYSDRAFLASAGISLTDRFDNLVSNINDFYDSTKGLVSEDGLDKKLEEYYTKIQTDSKINKELENYYTKDDTYSKYEVSLEIDEKLSNVFDELSNYQKKEESYTREETDNIVNQKLDNYYTQNETYTRSEIDGKLSYYRKNSESYTKEETDSRIVELSSGGELSLDNYYTKSEVDTIYSNLSQEIDAIGANIERTFTIKKNDLSLYDGYCRILSFEKDVYGYAQVSVFSLDGEQAISFYLTSDGSNVYLEKYECSSTKYFSKIGMMKTSLANYCRDVYLYFGKGALPENKEFKIILNRNISCSLLSPGIYSIDTSKIIREYTLKDCHVINPALKTSSITTDELIINDGNYYIQKSGESRAENLVYDGLDSTSKINALSANQGKVLNDRFDEYYSKSETDSRIVELSSGGDITLNGYYSKSETDDKIAEGLENYYTKEEVYSKSETDDKITSQFDWFYTKNESYNKTEVDNKLSTELGNYFTKDQISSNLENTYYDKKYIDKLLFQKFYTIKSEGSNYLYGLLSFNDHDSTGYARVKISSENFSGYFDILQNSNNHTVTSCVAYDGGGVVKLYGFKEPTTSHYGEYYLNLAPINGVSTFNVEIVGYSYKTILDEVHYKSHFSDDGLEEFSPSKGITLYCGSDIHIKGGAGIYYQEPGNVSGKYVCDDLYSTSTERPLSANQGRILKEILDKLSSNQIDMDFATIEEVERMVKLNAASLRETYYNKSEVKELIDKLGVEGVDLSSYYTKRQVDDKVAGDLKYYYKKAEVDKLLDKVESDVASTCYNKSEINSLISGVESDFEYYYNKSETNDLLDNIESNFSNYYKKSDIDDLISKVEISTEVLKDYYNKSETYNKEEIDALIDEVEVPVTDLTDYYKKSEVYNTEEIDLILDGIKAGGSTNLTGYYTKSEVDALIDSIPETDLTGYYTKSEVNSLINNIPETDLSNYYTKSEVYNTTETYNKEEIDRKIASASGGSGSQLYEYEIIYQKSPDWGAYGSEIHRFVEFNKSKGCAHINFTIVSSKETIATIDASYTPTNGITAIITSASGNDYSLGSLGREIVDEEHIYLILDSITYKYKDAPGVVTLIVNQIYNCSVVLPENSYMYYHRNQGQSITHPFDSSQYSITSYKSGSVEIEDNECLNGSHSFS